MLDKKDHSAIKFQRINEQTGDIVEWKNVVKAFKLKVDHVILGEKDFQMAKLKKQKRSISASSSRKRKWKGFTLKRAISVSPRKRVSFY